MNFLESCRLESPNLLSPNINDELQKLKLCDKF